MRALIFSLLLSAPFLLELARYPAGSIFSFNDVDEPNYLSVALSIGRGLPAQSFYLEASLPQNFLVLLSRDPSTITQFFFGYVADLAGLSPAKFGLCMDLGCAALAYFLLTLAFRGLGRTRLIEETAAAAMLAFPWTFWIGTYWTYDWPSSSHFVSAAVGPLTTMFYPRLPILRGVQTQVSYIFFALTIGACLKLLRSNKGELLRVGLSAGFCISALLYCYFFAWAAGILFAVICILARGDAAFLESPWRNFVPLLTALALGSAPGLYIILGLSHSELPHLSELKDYYFFPLEYLTAALACLALGVFLRQFPHERRLIWALGLFPIAEIGFSALQPLSSIWLEPEHVGHFFLQPLGTALATLALLNLLCFSEFLEISIGRLCLGFLWLIMGLISFSFDRFLTSDNTHRAELGALSALISEHLEKDAVIAAETFSNLSEDLPPATPLVAALPGQVRALSGRHQLFQIANHLAAVPAQERFEREALMRWALTGTPTPFPLCAPNNIALPGDLFRSTSTLRLLQRYRECKELAPIVSICKLLKTYRLDAAVTPGSQEAPRSAGVSRYRLESFLTPKGEFKLMVFDYARAQKEECAE